MKFRSICLWIILVGFLYFSVIGAAPARAANNVLNPFHCDFNKDSKADVLWRNITTGEVYVWYMNGINPPTSAQVLPTLTDQTWQIVACGDLLDNGNTGIVWIQNSTNNFAFWLENGITLTQSCVINAPFPWKGENGADMDGKGPLDLLWRNPNTGQHAIWYMNGCGKMLGSANLTTLPPEWHVKATGDFNADGNADLLWVDQTTGQVAIWLMNNTTILGSAEFGPYSGWSAKQVADFNGDGKSDILWVNSNTGQVAIWFMNGTTIASTANLPSVSSGWCAAGVDDYNGDGHVDLLWYNVSTGQVAVWLMNGSKILQSGIIATVPLNWYPVAGSGACTNN